MLTKLLHEIETLATTIKHNLTQTLAFQTTATTKDSTNQNANLQKTEQDLQTRLQTIICVYLLQYPLALGFLVTRLAKLENRLLQ